MTKRENIRLEDGIHAAILTPMNNDLSINFNLLADYMRWLFESGTNGIALLGTTGEANSFSLRERKELIDNIVQKGIDPGKLLIGTGCCALTDTIELTNHALIYNPGGILMLPPFYYKNVSDKALLEYFTLVIDKIARNEPKIYLYHFPRMTAVPFTEEVTGLLLDKFPGIIVGMKDSGGDVGHMKKMMQSFPDLQYFAGTEKYLLDVVKAGGAGCISATVNVTAKLAAAVFAERNGDKAEMLQKRLTEVRAVFDAFPAIPSLKRYLSDIQHNPGWLNIRPPNYMISKREYNTIANSLRSLQFDVYSKV